MGESGSGSPWKTILNCLNPSTSDDGASSRGVVEGLWWFKDLGKHVNGEFSMAVIQGNNIMEDYSQLESGPLSSIDSGLRGTFVGIYDGHAGNTASRYIGDHLFEKLKGLFPDNQEMSGSISNTFQEIEEEFLSVVRKEWESRPEMASVGSCCLVGIVCNGRLCIANAGDSRAVLGKLDTCNNKVNAVQLSTIHNASLESVRDELKSLHPDDPNIVVLKDNDVWRVKGIIQVSRSIGDAYLKSPEFNRPPLAAKYLVAGGLEKPIMVAYPSTHVQVLCAEDRFLILASDGLWDHITNQEAVDIVTNSGRKGVARELVKAALRKAADKGGKTYSQLKKVDLRLRRSYHDDISVIVLYLDYNSIATTSSIPPTLSLKWG